MDKQQQLGTTAALNVMQLQPIHGKSLVATP